MSGWQGPPTYGGTLRRAPNRKNWKHGPPAASEPGGLGHGPRPQKPETWRGSPAWSQSRRVMARASLEPPLPGRHVPLTRRASKGSSKPVYGNNRTWSRGNVPSTYIMCGGLYGAACTGPEQNGPDALLGAHTTSGPSKRSASPTTDDRDGHLLGDRPRGRGSGHRVPVGTVLCTTVVHAISNDRLAPVSAALLSTPVRA